MARNTANLNQNNVFKTAATTDAAAGILVQQLAAYLDLLRPLQNTALLAALRENDMKQVRAILAALMVQLDEWLKLADS